MSINADIWELLILRKNIKQSRFHDVIEIENILWFTKFWSYWWHFAWFENWNFGFVLFHLNVWIIRSVICHTIYH